MTVVGRVGAVDAAGAKEGAEDQRKTLLKDCQKEADALGMQAILRELARSLSTAALTRYAIAILCHYMSQVTGRTAYDQWYA